MFTVRLWKSSFEVHTKTHFCVRFKPLTEFFSGRKSESDVIKFYVLVLFNAVMSGFVKKKKASREHLYP